MDITLGSEGRNRGKNTKQISVQAKKEVWEIKQRHGERTWKILKLLTHGAVFTGELFMACSPGAKYMKGNSIERRHRAIDTFFKEEKERDRFYSLLSYLQKSGLIMKERGDERTLWRITENGSSREAELHKRLEKKITISLPTNRYAAEKSDDLILVIFDVPERNRLKRNWLRSALQNMGFVAMQKSVWAGEVKLPRDFLIELKKLNLTTEVKIFSAVQLGNLYTRL